MPYYLGEMRVAKGDEVCMTSDLGSRKCSAQVMGRLEVGREAQVWPLICELALFRC